MIRDDPEPPAPDPLEAGATAGPEGADVSSPEQRSDRALSGREMAELCEALRARYSEQELEHLVRYELDTPLYSIVERNTHEHVVFQLVAWTERKQLTHVLQRALTQRPAGRSPAEKSKRNPRLQPTLGDFLVAEGGLVWRTMLIAAVAGVVVALIALASVGWGSRVPDLVVTAVLTVQLVAVVVMWVSLFLVRDPDPERYPAAGRILNAAANPTVAAEGSSLARFAVNAARSREQYLQVLLVLFGSWACLYALLVGENVARAYVPDAPAVYGTLGVLQTTANNAGTAALFVAFYIMNYATTGPASDPQGGAERAYRHAQLFGFLLTLAYTIAQAAALLLATNISFAAAIFDGVSGLAAGVMIALWVGRFDSKLIDANPYVLLGLYVYAAIQPLWVMLTATGLDEPWVVAAMFGTALLCKIVVFPFSLWLLQSGRLLFYFVEVRRASERAWFAWRSLASEDVSTTDELPALWPDSRAAVSVLVVLLLLVVLMAVVAVLAQP